MQFKINNSSMCSIFLFADQTSRKEGPLKLRDSAGTRISRCAYTHLARVYTAQIRGLCLSAARKQSEDAAPFSSLGALRLDIIILTGFQVSRLSFRRIARRASGR